MNDYVVIIEKGDKPRSYGAYVPDLPGCVATGTSRAQVRARIRAAVELHVAGMREDGLPIPKSTAVPEFVTLSHARGGGLRVVGPKLSLIHI